MKRLRFQNDIVGLPHNSFGLPLVSIVVPTYNTPAFLLERCLASLFGQTYSNIEVIVVDDGSAPEHLGATVRSVSRDPRACLIPAGHGGVSHARNVGMESAHGEWLVFSDADDEVEPVFVEEALAVASVTGADVVCGGVLRITRNGLAKGRLPEGELTILTGDEEVRSFALNMLTPLTPKCYAGPDYRDRGPWGKLYRVGQARSVRFDESVSIGEDKLFNYCIAERCSNIAVVGKSWYRYYEYKESTARSLAFSKRIESIEGILAARREGRSEGPLLTLAGASAINGARFILGYRGLKGVHNAAALLEFAYQKGCFASPAFEDFVLRPWWRVVVCLCSKRRFHLAAAYWGAWSTLSDAVSCCGASRCDTAQENGIDDV